MSVPSDKIAHAAPVPATFPHGLERVLAAFDSAHQDAPELGKNLRALLDASPNLKARIVDSIDRGHLLHFIALPAGENAAGRYDSYRKTIELPMEILKTAGSDPKSAAELVFAMGHETGHSLNRPENLLATGELLDSVAKASRSKHESHDYTQVVANFIAHHRKDEAIAHIGGFNALSSWVLNANPHAGLREIHSAHPDRMNDFIDRSGTPPECLFTLKAGLKIGAGMTLTVSPGNIEAMGMYYSDKPPGVARVGTDGNQDYAHYYGEHALQVLQNESDSRSRLSNGVVPRILVDLDKLGLDKNLLPDTFRHMHTATLKRERDTLPDPAQATHNGGSPPPNASKRTAGVERPEKRSRTDGAPDAATDEGEAQPPALYVQALEALRVEATVGGEALNNIAAAFALSAQRGGLTEIDGAIIAGNSHAIVFQGNPQSPQCKRCVVDIDAAKSLPAADTLRTMSEESYGTAQQEPSLIHDSSASRRQI